MDKEYITQLVIDELVGDLTPEDAAILEKILQENPAAVILRENVIKLLTEGDMKGALEEEVSVERALTILTEQKDKISAPSFKGRGTAIILVLLAVLGFSVYTYQRQAVALKRTKGLQAVIYKHPLLMFRDGSFLRLDKINDNKITNLTPGKQYNTAFIRGPINQFEKATLITPRGENYQLVLPDGSTLYAGPKSTVTFFLSHTSPSRKIAVSGLAFLKVAPDPQRPFIVDLPQEAKINVLGTAFNINTDEQQGIQVSLEEGSVKVENGKGAILLEPGFAASWQKGTSINKMKFDKDTVSLWRQGRYICSKATLRDLARLMELCHPYPVSIDVPASLDTSHFIVGELVRGESIEDFLNTVVVFPSRERFKFHFDKDSTLHISLNHVR